jgi:hypothetical protein
MTYFYSALICKKLLCLVPVKYACKYRYHILYIPYYQEEVEKELFVQTDLFKEGGPLIWLPLPLRPSPTTAGSELVC